MNLNSTSEVKSTNSNWLLIGQLKLSIDSLSVEVVDAWLINTLEPFKLPTELIDTLRASARDTVFHLSASPDILHSILTVYTSQKLEADNTSGRNWGFFKLKRSVTTSDDETSALPVIEYYLYLEK